MEETAQEKAQRLGVRLIPKICYGENNERGCCRMWRMFERN